MLPALLTSNVSPASDLASLSLSFVLSKISIINSLAWLLCQYTIPSIQKELQTVAVMYSTSLPLKFFSI